MGSQLKIFQLRGVWEVTDYILCIYSTLGGNCPIPSSRASPTHPHFLGGLIGSNKKNSNLGQGEICLILTFGGYWQGLSLIVLILGGEIEYKMN